jgi:PhzF family phenazine biosynthesis protein
MSNSLFIIDAFTDRAFAGNPAAVCILNSPASDLWMQQVASEMNLSETAFVHPLNSANYYGLRWFTPQAEVALCGHATLAASHLLWALGTVGAGEAIKFQTLSGDLTASRLDDGRIELDFPAKECHDYAPPLELIIALGVQPKSVQRNSMDILIELDSVQKVLGVAPDFSTLKDVKDVRGVILTAASDDPAVSGYDFVSRFFAPAVGIDEDPVTGSAHCALGPYWAKRLGKNLVTGFQASKRGGYIQVRMLGDRVNLIGTCITMLEGKFLTPDEPRG